MMRLTIARSENFHPSVAELHIDTTASRRFGLLERTALAAVPPSQEGAMRNSIGCTRPYESLR